MDDSVRLMESKGKRGSNFSPPKTQRGRLQILCCGAVLAGCLLFLGAWEGDSTFSGMKTSETHEDSTMCWSFEGGYSTDFIEELAQNEGSDTLNHNQAENLANWRRLSATRVIPETTSAEREGSRGLVGLMVEGPSFLLKKHNWQPAHRRLREKLRPLRYHAGGKRSPMPSSLTFGVGLTDVELVADLDGPGSQLHGRCTPTGDIEWGDGRVWRRAVWLSEVLGASIELAKLAGEKIQNHHSTVFGGDTRIKTQTDDGIDEPVTEADEASNAIIVNGYHNRFPQLSIFSEEMQPPKLPPSLTKPLELSKKYALSEDFLLRQSDVLVTVDPLDATKEYTEDLVEYVTTQQCIVVGGRPLAGIIHQPFGGISPTVGIVPTGQVMGGVHASDPSGAAKKTVTLSRSHTGDGKTVVENYLPGYSPLPAGGAGYKTLLVVEGKAAAYLHVTKSKVWDACAADALITALGGKFSDISGSPIRYDPNDPVLRHGMIGVWSSKKHGWFTTQLQQHPINLKGEGHIPVEATLLSSPH